MGAGIGAIFRAPLGGAVMAAEILYIHDLEVEALIPGLIASIVGYSVFGAIEGWEPIFGAQPDLGFEHPVDPRLLRAARHRLRAGRAALRRVFYGIDAICSTGCRCRAWLKPALGGLLVGLIGARGPRRASHRLRLGADRHEPTSC